MCCLRYSSYIGSTILIDPNATAAWYVEPEGLAPAEVLAGSQNYVVSANRNSYTTDQLFQVEDEVNSLAANMKLGFAYQVGARPI